MKNKLHRKIVNNLNTLNRSLKTLQGVNTQTRKLHYFAATQEIERLKNLFANENDGANRLDEDEIEERDRFSNRPSENYSDIRTPEEDELTEIIEMEPDDLIQEPASQDEIEYLNRFGLREEHLPLVFATIQKYLDHSSDGGSAIIGGQHHSMSRDIIITAPPRFVKEDQSGDGPFWEVDTFGKVYRDRLTWSFWIEPHHPNATDNSYYVIPGTKLQVLGES